MNPKTVQILDHLLFYSLWVFLAFLATAVLYIYRRRRKKGTSSSLFRSLARASLLSLVPAVLFFVFIGFVPLGDFENFAWNGSAPTAPLRLTALVHERSYEGFNLTGEVWNQTDQDIPSLTAVVQIWRSERELLDEVNAPVIPQPFPSGNAGSFSIVYTKNSPFLYGYSVFFADGSGRKIPHIKGFDVH
ncbi:MAG: hypothetical protein HY645_10260 [Acidobacteria bacterium]|nr:hypothetical protein [Acidobacteriota bacterium]